MGCTVGGPPIFYPPQGAAMVPNGPYPGSQPTGQVFVVPAQQPAPRTVAGPPPARPVVARGLPPSDSVKPVTVQPALPSPESLGITATPPSPEQLGIRAVFVQPAVAPLDWNATRKRLQDLHAVTFQLERPADNVFRFSIALPTATAGKTYRVEGSGPTETEAVRSALESAEKGSTATP